MINRILPKLKREIGKFFYKREAVFPTGRKVVSFTFDDFPVSAIEVGARVLEGRGVRGTYYAAFGMAGNGDIPSREVMLSVVDRGHELGCHTYSHIDCGAHSARALELECRKNQEIVDSLTSLKLCSFAYPFGEYSAVAKKAVGGIFQSARTVEPGINRKRIDLMNLYAVPIDVRGGMDSINYWIDALKEDDGWLIFFSHELRDDPSIFGATEDQFAQCVDLCVNAGFEVLTVSEAVGLCLTGDNF